MTRDRDEPIDIVYTWVDDSFPGYLETLNRYVADPRDTNPNRTRDNLDIVRYSLRSVAQNLPWARRIYFVSMRPQVPVWLNTDHPKLRVVHHDEIMDASILPTFNSFCIVSHLHKLPGVSPRFIYFEDDMLAMSPDLGDALFAPDGRPHVHLKPMQVVPRAKLDSNIASPWNLSLTNADAALSKRFGPGPRQHITHGPQVMGIGDLAAIGREFPELIAKTRTSRFRGGDNIPPEFLSRHLALETGQAVRAPDALSRLVQGYASLENLWPWTWVQLTRVARRRSLSVTLNDSFGDMPNARAEALVRARLNAWFPDPSPFEKPATR